MVEKIMNNFGNSNTILITDYNAPYGGNLLRSFIALEKQMVSDGNQLFYLFPKRAAEKDWVIDLMHMSDKERVFFFEEDPISIAKTIKEIARKYDVNIVYAHLCRHKTQIGIALARHVWQRGSKLVQHYHNHAKIPHNVLKKVFNIAGYKILFNGDLAIGCSKSVAESIPLSKKKKVYVDNAIDFTRLDTYDADYRILPEGDDRKTVLLFGFHYSRKGVDIALDAMAPIAERENVVLALCLAANKEEIEQKIIEKYGKIPNWVVFLGPRDDVGTYYHSADIFLSAAREEGFCYSIVESVYCGDICISSRIGGCPLQIPGLYIFETENSKELQETLIEILHAQPEELQKRKKESRDYSVVNYHVETWAKGIVDILYDLV